MLLEVVVHPGADHVDIVANVAVLSLNSQVRTGTYFVMCCTLL